jgi:hypothetical protein
MISASGTSDIALEKNLGWTYMKGVKRAVLERRERLLLTFIFNYNFNKVINNHSLINRQSLWSRGPQWVRW